MTAKGSENTVLASSNVTPYLVAFEEAFFASHSKLSGLRRTPSNLRLHQSPSCRTPAVTGRRRVMFHWRHALFAAPVDGVVGGAIRDGAANSTWPLSRLIGPMQHERGRVAATVEHASQALQSRSDDPIVAVGFNPRHVDQRDEGTSKHSRSVPVRRGQGASQDARRCHERAGHVRHRVSVVRPSAAG